MAQIGDALRTLLAGDAVGNWRAPDGENYDVNVRLAPESRASSATCSCMPTSARRADGSPRIVRAARRSPTCSRRPAPNQINRRDLNREINFDANAFGRSRATSSADIKQGARRASRWPPGYRYSSAARPRT